MFFVQLSTIGPGGEKHLRWYDVTAATLPQAHTAAVARVRQELGAVRIRILEARRLA